MEKLEISDLGPVQRTLLIPLCCRAGESHRPDALLKDETAVKVVEKIEGDLPYLAKMTAWVLPYFEEQDVKRLVLALRAKIPGSELVFDAQSPLLTKLHNRELVSMGLDARLNWSVRDDGELERWAEGIHLVEAWRYFDRPEPRLGWARLLRWIPVMGNGARILHYQMGVGANTDAPECSGGYYGYQGIYKTRFGFSRHAGLCRHYQTYWWL